MMRTLCFLFLCFFLVACKTANPNFCCTTEQQCTELGSSELRPCRAGQACNTGTCVAKECDTSADCTDASDPVCINQLCEAKCTGDADCTGSPGGLHCASDGVCVGCVDASQCSADKPFCDDQTRSCRGCIADNECASGVCNESTATCVADTDTVYVTQFGTDSGPCTKQAPCETISFALQRVIDLRKTIHLSGGLVDSGGTVTIDRNVTIDGSNTTLRGPNGVLFKVGNGVDPFQATIEGVQVPADGSISVTKNSVFHITNSTVASGVTVNGSLIVSDTSFTGSTGVTCTNGTVTIDRTQFHLSSVLSGTCALTVTRSTFDEGVNSISIRAVGGVAVIENNLITHSYELADSMHVEMVSVGSRIWFNTFVNTSGIASDGTALFCDSTVDVSSNIFAYGSQHPHSPVPVGIPVCPAKFSVYDEVALPEQRMGEGDIQVAHSSLFRNETARDFHLTTTSPAIGKGQTGLDVQDDLDGRSRPRPIGSAPDVGCFEAP